MHHTVTHSLDFIKALDAALGRVGEQVEDGTDGLLVIGEAELDSGFCAVGFLIFKESVVEAELFGSSLGKNF